MVLLLYTTYISEDIAHYEIFLAKAGKGGIIHIMLTSIIHSLLSKSSATVDVLGLTWLATHQGHS